MVTSNTKAIEMALPKHLNLMAVFLKLEKMVNLMGFLLKMLLVKFKNYSAITAEEWEDIYVQAMEYALV